jgi:hypothetical protein
MAVFLVRLTIWSHHPVYDQWSGTVKHSGRRLHPTQASLIGVADASTAAARLLADHHQTTAVALSYEIAQSLEVTSPPSSLISTVDDGSFTTSYRLVVSLLLRELP